MHQAVPPHKRSTLKSRHFIAVAWLLIAAQLLSVLHGLEHLEGADHDEHSEEVCQLCILSAGLDYGGIDTFVEPGARLRAVWHPLICGKNFTPELLTSYQGRAPPLSASIA